MRQEVHAGGSGLNTVVVVNQSSSNSCALGSYFCERRQIPAENVLFIQWAGGNISWTANDMQTNLIGPLLSMLSSRNLTNQIDYLVLSMDIPFETINTDANSNVNSTTSALFYGVKDDLGTNSMSVANSYATCENVFRQARPATAPGFSFLTTMLTGSSLAQAESVVDEGVVSDGTFPSQPVVLARSSDMVRNVRYRFFDNAIFNTRLCGNYFIQRTNSDTPSGQSGLLGYETGLGNFSISSNTFVPGAMADSLTSFGGIIFGYNDQTSLLAFIGAGATGSYGTVVEPSAATDKFPNPQAYFYQARGFSLAECYYQSINSPYEGLIVAEPLAAPFQHSATGNWSGISSNALLSGTAQISVQFSAVDADHPLQQLDLFVDGKFSRTLTNLPPLPGNTLNITLTNAPVAYTVPTNATLTSIASDLAARVNASAATNGNRISAVAHGDRLELHSLVTNRLSVPSGFHVAGGGAQSSGTNGSTGASSSSFAASAAGSANAQTTFLGASRGPFLNSQALGVKACAVSGTVQPGSWLQIDVTKTGGVHVTLAVTNQSPTAQPFDLASQLVNLINATASLQGPDGVSADELAAGVSNAGLFNLRARSPGTYAATLQVILTGSSSLILLPGSSTTLTDNLSDLQPRNHFYVRAGSTNLALTFPLDTTAFPDGYHELAVIAYEGSSVRTQTRLSLPVVFKNTPLSATLTRLDLPDPSPVIGTYHIQVSANTNNVSAISLYTTGGLIGAINGQTSATFAVNGPAIGVGLHPFYAVVQAASGRSYRTQPQWVRLSP